MAAPGTRGTNPGQAGAGGAITAPGALPAPQSWVGEGERERESTPKRLEIGGKVKGNVFTEIAFGNRMLELM